MFCILQRKMQFEHTRLREKVDGLSGNTHHLIEGLKELKVDSVLRRQFFMKDSNPKIYAYHTQQAIASRYDQLAITLSWLVFYAVLASAVLLLSLEDIGDGIAFILPLLMLFGPITMVVTNMSTIYSAKAALNRLVKIQTDESEHYFEENIDVTSIELNEIKYQYGEGFALGSIDYLFRQGEVVFITGGNGSGKSSLLKLLTGLYTPSSGSVMVNGKNVLSSSQFLKNYQASLSVIYQVPHIFSNVFTVDLVKQCERFEYFSEVLGLKENLDIKDNVICNAETLSYGQKKRLRLLLALLEDRAVYIFDEWAADQDPYFREVFYTEILGYLKSHKKCVIAVTHDDAYFDKADRLIKLDAGKMAN